MKIVKLIFLTCLLLFFSVPLYAQPPKPLVFSTADTNTSAITAYFQLLQKAYDEIGYRVELNRLPGKRTFAHANDGKVDGVLISTKQILKLYNNIVVVPVKLTQVTVLAYSNGKNFKFKGLGDLKPYKIGILREYPLTVKLTAGMNRQIVDNYNSLFSLLQLREFDMVISLKREAQRFLHKNPRFKDVTPLAPPILILPLYHFLNKKHEALVPQVTPIIIRLIKEKVLEKLYEPYQSILTNEPGKRGKIHLKAKDHENI